MISPSQRPLPDNTQHSQEIDIHARGIIRTHNPSKRAAKDPRLRPRGQWDRLLKRMSWTKTGTTPAVKGIRKITKQSLQLVSQLNFEPRTTLIQLHSVNTCATLFGCIESTTGSRMVYCFNVQNSSILPNDLVFMIPIRHYLYFPKYHSLGYRYNGKQCVTSGTVI
jgi:hypothetical protein